jgi:hypothetical protein
MRGARRCIDWLGATLLALAGCHAPEPNLKPEAREEYVLPPTDDQRFNSPPTYPKETLDTGTMKKEQGKPGDQFRDQSRTGMGGRVPGGY